VAANGRNGPVRSDSSGFERKLIRWRRIRPVVSDWYVGFSVGFSEWRSSRAIYSGLYSVSSYAPCCSPTALEVESE
jgi:hypothetical protein